MPGYKNPYTLNANLNDKKPIQPVVEERAEDYRHAIVTSQKAVTGSIIAHIEGSSMVVDYYAQLKGFNDEPKEYDPNQSHLNQQYHKIINLEIKSQSQDTNTEDRTNRVMMSGTAVIYAGVIPNHGDVMIADIGNGQAGRLTVKNPVKKQYMATTVYEFEYELIDFLDTENKVKHIDSFVVKTSVFNRDLITYGNDPLLLESDHADRLEAMNVEQELIDDFLKEFFSNELSTFLVPDYGNQATYDPYIVEAFREVVGIDEHPLMQRLKTINMNELREVYSFSIWPVLLYPEVNKVRNIWKRIKLVPRNQFAIEPRFASFRYSGFYQCIAPAEDLDNVDYYQGYAQRSKTGTILSVSRIYQVLNTGGFGTDVASDLANALGDQNKICCHHLVHYHEANGMATGVESKRYMDMVHTWVRATGHWSACAICGGCNECCDGNHDGDKDKNGCPNDDPNAYVLPSSYWMDGVLDDVFSSLVRRYLNGDRIPLRELINYAMNRMSLSRRDRFYHMMVILIILRSSIRSI